MAISSITDFPSLQPNPHSHMASLTSQMICSKLASFFSMKAPFVSFTPDCAGYCVKGNIPVCPSKSRKSVSCCMSDRRLRSTVSTSSLPFLGLVIFKTPGPSHIPTQTPKIIRTRNCPYRILSSTRLSPLRPSPILSKA